MGKITLILGGARSGKSQYAVKLACENTQQVLFIATASGLDKEMRLRIKFHKKNRPSHWNTIGEPKKLVSLLKKTTDKAKLVIIDCLTLFISNLLLDGYTDRHIENECKLMLNILKTVNFDSILVSNEVGLGIVPDNVLARRFRDLGGRINQMVSARADKVYFMVAGSPINLKGVNDEKN